MCCGRDGHCVRQYKPDLHDGAASVNNITTPMNGRGTKNVNKAGRDYVYVVAYSTTPKAPSSASLSALV